MRCVPAAVLLVALLTPALAACGGSDRDSYCDAVHDHQTKLTDIVSSTDPAALLQARDILTDLQDRAPSDITQQWKVLVDAIDGLRDALDAAGVDPGTYDRAHPPAGVTAEQRQAIDEASTRLASPDVAGALEAVDQEVRDVCHTPLTL